MGSLVNIQMTEVVKGTSNPVYTERSVSPLGILEKIDI